MQKRVLIAAEEIDLRARIARLVQSAGYGVELADNEKRALKLALNHKFNGAFVAPSQSLGVSMLEELHVTIPKILVLSPQRPTDPQSTMQPTDSDTTDLRSTYETACRDFWFAHVMIEAGERPPATTGPIFSRWRAQRSSLAVPRHPL